MKQKITKFLVNRTKKYIEKKRPIIVGVTGSVGKTSTTQAIATVLGEKYNVRCTKGNYNTDIGVVMSVFDEDIQTRSIQWMLLCARVFKKSLGVPQNDVYVLELGSDAPGQLKDFTYLHPDIAVVTAVTPEHMEFFKTIDAVALEELLVSHFSESTLVNTDMVDPKLLKQYAQANALLRYGSGQAYDIITDKITPQGAEVLITLQNRQIRAITQLVAKHSMYTILAGAAVSDRLGLSDEQISAGIAKVKSMPGRMNILKGIKNSTIIDDSYNFSPEAGRAALDTLYAWDAPQRIALLGMMNELGDHSAAEHSRIGEYCDPSKIDLVVTLGQDANTYLADAAKKRGCTVVSVRSPVEAGEAIKEHVKNGAVILAKGSQNGVYAEEAVKLLLADPSDSDKLVRQKSYWLPKKRKQFPEIG